MSNNWCTIESDPGVFSELLVLFGVKNAQVDEIYSLDDESLHTSSSYGLIFLFKYVQETDDRPTISFNDCPDLFYAKQVITNACATQAILSVILNADDIDIGATLDEFKQFTTSLDPETKGYAIGNSDVIRNAHNAFAPQSFEMEGPTPKAKSGKGDAYHFVAYIPFNGIVYELDGLKAGPIILGATSSDATWLSVATPAIEERMLRYSSNEVSFALLNICPKRTLLIKNEIEFKSSELSSLDSDTSITNESVKAVLMEDIRNLTEQLNEEDMKIHRQTEENKRRRHGYMPFMVTLLRILSEKGKLKDMVTAGTDRARTQQSNMSSRRSKN
jgi:ubiquitin carboxyl-terminal hydrolase L5